MSCRAASFALQIGFSREKVEYQKKKDLMKTSAILAALALLTYVCPSRASEGILGYTSSAGGFVTGTAGWTFHAETDISVNALGCLDYLFDVQGPLSVGLWDADGSLLASSSISAASPPVNESRYEAITPVTLFAGVTYHIGAYSPSGTIILDAALPGEGGSVHTSPEIQLETAAVGYSDFTFPNDLQGGPGAALLTANFSYTVVPEPTAAGLILLGALMVGICRTR
jgi:hypothetical protein